MKKILKNAFIKSLPVMAGYIVLGFGFGVLSAKAGYGIVWALAMSVFIYAGSMQYVTVSLLSSGVSLITAALTTLMVNARHIFYGIAMLGKYKKAGAKKPYLIFGLTDETYSIVCSGQAPEDVDFKSFSFYLSLFNQCYWIMGSVLGAILGTYVQFNSAGVEFVMTALFITIFVDQWRNTSNHYAAIIGVGVTLICLLIFGAESFLIPAMVIITALLCILKKYICKGGAQNE